MFKFLFGGAGRLDMSDAVARAERGELVVVDVRDASELAATGKARGAVHIPLATIQFRTDPRHPDFEPALSEGKPVAIYCASGARSHMAARVMRNNGFDEVHNLGRFAGWSAAGGKVERA